MLNFLKPLYIKKGRPLCRTTLTGNRVHLKKLLQFIRDLIEFP